MDAIARRTESDINHVKRMAQMAGGFKRYTENGKFTAEVILPIQAETMPSE